MRYLCSLESFSSFLLNLIHPDVSCSLMQKETPHVWMGVEVMSAPVIVVTCALFRFKHQQHEGITNRLF